MYRTAVATLVCVLSFDVLAQERPRRIIDVHLHAYRDGPGWPKPPANAAVQPEARPSSGSAEQMAQTLAEIKRLNIVKGIVSGHRDAVLRWHAAAPEQIIIGRSFGSLSDIDIPALRREHAAGQLHVIGEISPQYEGMTPDDARLEPLFALAEELDIPVGLHMHPGPPGAPYVGRPKTRAAKGDPLLLEDVLVRHPKLRLYVMHAGWPFLDRTIALLYEHPQVYVDVGVIDWSLPRKEFYRFLRGLVDAGYGKRILFGSDQMFWPGRIAQAVKTIEEADFLTPEQKDDIFYNNASTFLRMKAESIGPTAARER